MYIYLKSSLVFDTRSVTKSDIVWPHFVVAIANCQVKMRYKFLLITTQTHCVTMSAQTLKPEGNPITQCNCHQTHVDFLYRAFGAKGEVRWSPPRFDWNRSKLVSFIRPWISPGFFDLPTDSLYTTAHGEIECVKVAKLNFDVNITLRKSFWSMYLENPRADVWYTVGKAKIKQN